MIQKDLNSHLRIDEVKAIEGIKRYLKQIYYEHHVSGVLIGLSGGIDSTVLATLAVLTFGKEFVHLCYLYDQYSDQECYRNARLVSEYHGLEIEEQSIETEMRKIGVYSSPEMKVSSFSKFLNRMLHQIYRTVFRETPFVTSLRLGNTETSKKCSDRKRFESIILSYEAGMNARHIYRRKVLEEKAHKMNWLLLGAANRTEWLTGWFVKDGIDDVPLEPLEGLYKTQIRQLAVYLNVPIEVIEQAPSPDMIKGITDEFALSMSYRKIDLILDYLDGGLTKKIITDAGCGEEEIRLVEKMKLLSKWKRGSAHLPFPVDGGPFGGLRL